MQTRWFSVLALTCMSVQATLPCAGVFRNGQEAFIASESALIAWNEDSQTETFIRRANFQGKGSDFGFIVPTPTEPELSEVDDSLFTTLSTIIAARFRGNSAGIKSAGGGLGGGGGGGHVEVVKEQVVSGMKATVLRATDTRALGLWLANNGYPASPQVIRWTQYYVRNDFYLTAFKIDRKLDSERLKTAAVKMVFRSTAPFYPYREPASNLRQRGRTLAVYFLGPWQAQARYVNALGRWNATRNDIRDLKQGEIQSIQAGAKLGSRETAGHPYLTYFLDSNVVRPDSDVVFERQIGFF
jgi:hypothetical protein